MHINVCQQETSYRSRDGARDAINIRTGVVAVGDVLTPENLQAGLDTPNFPKNAAL